MIGLSLIPAFGTLYQRLTMPESKRYLASRKRPDDVETLKAVNDERGAKILTDSGSWEAKDKSPTKAVPEQILGQKAHFAGQRTFHR